MPRDIDYYGLLGVARDASETEIRERFRALARGAHPDRAPANKKAEAEAKFQDLTEAVNVLTNPEKRKSYDFDLAAAAGMAGDGDPVAQNYLGQGIAAFKDRKFAEAAGNFQLAVGRNPRDVKAQHYLGLASARAGDVRTAVKAIETALAIEPHNGAVLKDAGSIFRQAGLLLKAEKAYQEAIRWDPAAGDARKALEEIRVQRAGRG
ncbi:MAG TPA: DnaJ domain-containing protein [Thermoanaerobaculia bacterium]|jgi:DnaJ-class molecular chaperone|nr:DnaJ domain-containing protein [Thermoanaerobaculia bacterium]